MNKLLIVDDSHLILAMGREILKNAPNLEADIETLDNGEEAIERLSGLDVDLVILDVVMPGINGIDILKYMKDNGVLEHTKAIMFTSLSDKAFMKECFENGASDYIQKPLEPNEFVARIRSALNEQNLRKQLVSTIETIKGKNEELSALYKELTEAQSKLMLREQMNNIGRLAAGIAHEINTPLGYVSSNVMTLKNYVGSMRLFMEGLKTASDEDRINRELVLELMKRHEIKRVWEDFQGAHQDILEGISKIGFIVNSLRTFSRIDSFQGYEPYDINEALQQIVILTKMESMEVATVDTDFHPVPVITAKGGEMNQALLNIIKNAIYAIREKQQSEVHPAKGHIQIQTGTTEGGVYCSIKDSGKGISEEVRQSMFAPFFTTRDVGEGMGLGLSISYEIIVNQHQGRIEVESQMGQGTCFTVTLPLDLNEGRLL